MRTTTVKVMRIIITIRECFPASGRMDSSVLTSAWGGYARRDDHSDGSVFYRYSDGSEYYRRKNGNITFRPPVDTPNVEETDPTATPASTAAKERSRQPWYDWPPQLNLSVKTDGSSVIIRDASSSTVTFEPVGANAEVGPAPVHDRSMIFFINRNEG